jgi:hypothetical protein
MHPTFVAPRQLRPFAMIKNLARLRVPLGCRTDNAGKSTAGPLLVMLAGSALM